MLDDRAIRFRTPFPAGADYLPFRQLGPKLPAVQWITGPFPRGESSQSVSLTKYNHVNTARYEKLVLYLHFSIRRFWRELWRLGFCNSIATKLILRK
jgi:hypothetical protein